MKLLHVGLIVPFLAVASQGLSYDAPPRIISFLQNQELRATWNGAAQSLAPMGQIGPWTLVERITTAEQKPAAVFENFEDRPGRMLVVGSSGVIAEFGKTEEPTFCDDPAKLYHGHSMKEVFDSPRDLLGSEILAQKGDPQYDEVARCFPPLTRGSGTFTFIGIRENSDKVGFEYGGRSPDFDPAVYVPAIRKIRNRQRVWHGLVGGWLPILRFVYPDGDGSWSEMIAFAPPRTDNNNAWIQPIWYRVCRIENRRLSWVRYFDSYHPFPPRNQSAPAEFYRDLLAMRRHWEHALADGMQVDIPDERLRDIAVHSLVRDMITRDGARPKYGVFDRSYGGNEHEGFPDILNTDVTAMTDWGLFGSARSYLDNYFEKYVRDDGSILYRGPETGQYGRMLTVAASYARSSGDYDLLIRHRVRLDGIVSLLLSLRRKALLLPKSDSAYGVPAGWCEADACLDDFPERYMQPYLSNAAEMVRGLRELGAAWQIAARRGGDNWPVNRGRQIVSEAEALEKDMHVAIERSTFHNVTPPCIPSIAGAKEPFHIACRRDRSDPQFRSYRAFMEMLFSGVLTADEVRTIVDYRTANHDVVLGVPLAYGYNTREMAGFLSYGHAYGLLQHDMVRQFLLQLYAIEAHQYSRGNWTAPETRRLGLGDPAASYCAAAQLVVPMMLRWMLVMEDPGGANLWLAKGTPRAWLADGGHFGVRNVPTRWGVVGYRIESWLKQNRIRAIIDLPPGGVNAPVMVRLRVLPGYSLKSAEVNGVASQAMAVREETITLPHASAGRITIEAHYARAATDDNDGR